MPHIKRKRIVAREPGYYMQGPTISRTGLLFFMGAGVVGLLFIAALVLAPMPEATPRGVTVTTFAPIPEPSTYAVVAGGMLMVFAGWRKWRR
jgi:hypothetical protein